MKRTISPLFLVATLITTGCAAPPTEIAKESLPSRGAYQLKPRSTVGFVVEANGKSTYLLIEGQGGWDRQIAIAYKSPEGRPASINLADTSEITIKGDEVVIKGKDGSVATKRESTRLLACKAGSSCLPFASHLKQVETFRITERLLSSPPGDLKYSDYEKSTKTSVALTDLLSQTEKSITIRTLDEASINSAIGRIKNIPAIERHREEALKKQLDANKAKEKAEEKRRAEARRQAERATEVSKQKDREMESFAPSEKLQKTEKIKASTTKSAPKPPEGEVSKSVKTTTKELEKGSKSGAAGEQQTKPLVDKKSNEKTLGVGQPVWEDLGKSKAN